MTTWIPMPTQCHLGQVIYVPTEHSRRRRVVLAYKPGHVLVWVAHTPGLGCMGQE
jgi:hypothetical protein